MRWITAQDITDWANRDPRRCQEKMPELIRKLIQAVAPSIKRIDFPCDGSITVAGWDGHLETMSQSPFFPDGLSKWEIGSEKTTGQKADKDYKTRKGNMLGAMPQETTYVAVSPRIWPKRSEWESTKKSEGFWKDVRAIGGDELETWIASAPAVGVWLARLIGKITPGIRDIGAMWEEWSVMTNPAMTPEVVISGRIDERDEIHKWLSRSAGVLSMQGDSPDEPFAFLYASMLTLPKEEQEIALSRCILIENINQLRDCCQTFSNPLIIAAPAECLDAANFAVFKGHHVFLSMDAKAIDIGSILRLTRPKRDALEKALEGAGLSETDAQKYMRDSGRSIPVLRRRLFRSALLKAPEWADANKSTVILPALFMGAWTDGKEGDTGIAEVLSGVKYDVFLEQFISAASLDDAPVRKVGNVWMLKSPLDAWFLIARYLTPQHFERFKTAISAVLTETNPKYELQSDQRWMAGYYGKTSRYSEWVKRGLVESLVLLAVYGERIPGINNSQEFADVVIGEILEGADTWQAWASLKEVMPLLAEASPQVFLDVLGQKIEATPSLFESLMRDEDNRYGFGDCQHSGLLWALEGIAWDPKYLMHASKVLLSLAQIDPGGRWSNRPLASLIDILLPGLPQTNAKPDQRLEVYSMIMNEDPRIAWKIAESHTDSGTISASHQFRWRDSGGNRAGLEHESRNDYLQYLNALIPMWSRLSCATNENIIAAVDHFLRLPEPVCNEVLSALQNLNPNSMPQQELRALLNNLRHALNWINNYDKEKKYAKHLPILKRVYETLIPKDPIEHFGWLFANGWPQLPDEPQGAKSHEQRLAEIRKEAARSLLDQVPLPTLLDYAQTLPYPDIFSHAIATAVETDREDAGIVDSMADKSLELPSLLIGYSMGRIEKIGEEWATDQADRLGKGGAAPNAIAAIYLGMPENLGTWSSVSSRGVDVEQIYWKQASGHIRAGEANSESSALAIEKLLSVGRSDAALDIAGDPHISLPSELLKRILLDLLRLESDRKKYLNSTMLEFHLTNIFNQLYERKELSWEEIGKLEWPYAQIFDHFNRKSNNPLALHRTLQKDPAFFVDLMSQQYKKDDGTEVIPEGLTEDQAKNIATNAREVLESWHLLPGISEDGTVDKNELSNWIDTARKIAKEKGYSKGCDLKLAEVLSRMPPDKDGMWPHTVLREIIEKLRSPMIDKHIPYAIYNSRGVRSRGVFEGGRQERELSESYREWAKKMASKWPRTSKILRSLADMFDRDAKREDAESELLDLGY